MALERHLSPKQPTRLRNIRCAYCNAKFTRLDEPQKEHVVGRRFTPLGSHNQQWNLHLNSCHWCNQDKSKLENDLSAITMFHGKLEHGEDRSDQNDALRKARTFSKRTGKPVFKSHENLEVIGN